MNQICDRVPFALANKIANHDEISAEMLQFFIIKKYKIMDPIINHTSFEKI